MKLVQQVLGLAVLALLVEAKSHRSCRPATAAPVVSTPATTANGTAPTTSNATISTPVIVSEEATLNITDGTSATDSSTLTTPASTAQTVLPIPNITSAETTAATEAQWPATATTNATSPETTSAAPIPPTTPTTTAAPTPTPTITSTSTPVGTEEAGTTNHTDHNTNSTATTIPVPTSSTVSTAFTPVRSIKVRVQGNLPVWDAEHQTYVTSYGATFDERYRAVLDTVNMASVEGALKYVQAECINQPAIVNCQRKSNVKYIVFYETVVAQPMLALQKTGNSSAAALEHCPYLAMDGGQCTPTNGVLPKECDEYAGTNGAEKLGFCIGGQLFDYDYLAPYPNTYWYSFPNSCPTQLWSNKTAQCRLDQAGGLCPFGAQPDGVTCTFSFKILGWVLLDDVVGITAMVNPATNKTYANYSEFCQAGGIEYYVASGMLVQQTIPFWNDPTNRAANAKRAQRVVDAYAAKIAADPKTSDGGTMQPLPSIESLRAANPPCYKNAARCANTGCRRHLYSQVCEVCSDQSDIDCVQP